VRLSTVIGVVRDIRYAVAYTSRFRTGRDPLMENETGTTIRRDVLLAEVVNAALPKHGSGELPSIERISSLLFGLKKAGIELGEIALRRIPGGFYSEDVETFIGHYLAAGYATQLSPLNLTDKGKEVLADTIAEERKENPTFLLRIESILEQLAD